MNVVLQMVNGQDTGDCMHSESKTTLQNYGMAFITPDGLNFATCKDGLLECFSQLAAFDEVVTPMLCLNTTFLKELPNFSPSASMLPHQLLPTAHYDAPVPPNSPAVSS